MIQFKTKKNKVGEWWDIFFSDIQIFPPYPPLELSSLHFFNRVNRFVFDVRREFLMTGKKFKVLETRARKDLLNGWIPLAIDS